MFTEHAFGRLMIVTWDLSSQEPVYAKVAEKAEGMQGWGGVEGCL